MYMEKLVENPRHIEFQVLGDEHGNVEILGERECSIQRRHQKLMEEAPSTAVTPELRARISESLRVALKEIGYTNAGTVEFLMDERGESLFHRSECAHSGGASGDRDGDRRRSGESADPHRGGRAVERDSAGPVQIRGHAIECRINAEHPETFAPSPGRITGLNLPGGTAFAWIRPRIRTA